MLRCASCICWCDLRLIPAADGFSAGKAHDEAEIQCSQYVQCHCAQSTAKRRDTRNLAGYDVGQAARSSHSILDGIVELFQRIRASVSRDQYLIGLHAAERLEQRGIMEWQAVDGLLSGRLLQERPDARPNAAIEILQILPDGTEYKAVWSWMRQTETAKLVTVHFLDGGAHGNTR